jgi:hypothetical protein
MVAYINHDVDDAIRAGILSETDFRAKLRVRWETGTASE